MEGDSWRANRSRPGALQTARQPDRTPRRMRSAAVCPSDRHGSRRTARSRPAAENGQHRDTPTGLDATVQVAADRDAGTRRGSGRPTCATRPSRFPPDAPQPLRRERAAGLLRAADRLRRHGRRQIRSRPGPANRALLKRARIVSRSVDRWHGQVKTPLLSEELHGLVYLAPRRRKPDPFGIAARAVHRRGKQTARAARQARRRSQSQPPDRPAHHHVSRTPHRCPSKNCSYSCSAVPARPLTTPPLVRPVPDQRELHALVPGTPFKPPRRPGNSTSPRAPKAAPAPTRKLSRPAFNAGATSLQAGGYTNFNLQLQRPDGQQALTGLTIHLPPANAAILADVTPCPEPQAAQGTCGPEAKSARPPPSPASAQTPYTRPAASTSPAPIEGAPFGLSIVTPAVAGPFNLGNVVVRSKIEVNPHTAQVTITSSLPTIVQGVGMPPSGIPLQLKQIDVHVNRPNFEYNPTNCNPMQIEGTLQALKAPPATSPPPSRSPAVRACPSSPASAQTQGKTSKANGASLADLQIRHRRSPRRQDDPHDPRDPARHG